MMSESRARTLQAHFSRSGGATLRPILTSLNGDNSWLISFPRPAADLAPHGGKTYFHVVSDAWLTRDAFVGSSWVINLRHPTAPAVADGPAVEAVVHEIETAAAASNPVSTTAPQAITEESRSLPVDAIFANFHYSDHLDERTLRTFPPETPVFATAEAAALIRPWNYFHHISQTHDLDPSNPTWLNLHPTGDAQLPEWLSVFRLVGHHELNFATAIVYSSLAPAPEDANQQQQQQKQQNQQHEVLLYSPHGIRSDQPSLQAFAHHLNPPVRVLAMLHALKDSFVMGWRRTTLGVAGGLALERLTRPKYWIKSHDASLQYSGIVAWAAWIKDITRTLQSGLDEERENGGEERKDGDGDGDGDGDAKKPNLVEVENGGCFVLE